jgi:hypothetical protein
MPKARLRGEKSLASDQTMISVTIRPRNPISLRIPFDSRRSPTDRAALTRRAHPPGDRDRG